MEVQETPINKKQNWKRLKRDYLTQSYSDFAEKYSAGNHYTHVGSVVFAYIFILVLRILFSIWGLFLIALYCLI